MKQEEIKNAGLESRALRSAGALLFVTLFFLITPASFGQSFDLLSAKSSDKVAESLFFTVDSNKVLNAYKIFSFTTPAVKTSDSIFVVDEIQNSVSGVGKSGGVAVHDFALEQNFPNPFNPSTTIRFTVSKRAKVSVVLYDVTGKEVATLVNDRRETGTFDAHWNGVSASGVAVASGTYFYRLLATADDGSRTVETKKMTLLR